MYKWCVDIILKGSGLTLHCLYEGIENNSGDVFEKLFAGKCASDVIGLAGESGRSITLVIAGEIAAVDIRAKNF